MGISAPKKDIKPPPRRKIPHKHPPGHSTPPPHLPETPPLLGIFNKRPSPPPLPPPRTPPSRKNRKYPKRPPRKTLKSGDGYQKLIRVDVGGGPKRSLGHPDPRPPRGSKEVRKSTTFWTFRLFLSFFGVWSREVPNSSWETSFETFRGFGALGSVVGGADPNHNTKIMGFLGSGCYKMKNQISSR